MPLICDHSHKILYIIPHKCGLHTLTTFINRIKNKEAKTSYYNFLFCNELKEEYKTYYKILIIRNIYEKFVSGFLQDLQIYKNTDLSFKELCMYLLSIHKMPNINYYIKNGTNITNDYYFTLGENCNHFKNKLNGHLQPMHCELEQFLNYFNYEVERIIFTSNLTELLQEINVKYNLNIVVEKGNCNYYKNDLKIDIKNMKLSDIYELNGIPPFKQFYDDEIFNAVKIMYADDIELLKKFNLTQPENYDDLIKNY